MNTLMHLLKLLASLAAIVVWNASPAVAQQPQTGRALTLDVARLRAQLTAPLPATASRAAAPATRRVELPTLHGTRPFVLLETHVLPATDPAASRRLRTFVGYEEGAPEHRVSVVLSPRELTADLLAGAESASLRPAANGLYQLQPEAPYTGACATPDAAGAQRPGAANLPEPFSFGTQLRTISMAVLVTQEYYAANGNNDAAVEAAVATAMNQMTALYLRELSVRYELVQPSGSTRYFSAVTTPTLPDTVRRAVAGRLREQSLEDVISAIQGRFAASAYDLGHCFHNQGGGVAYVGAVCNSGVKAGAWSGVTRTGFQQVLAHEMGHQHGASHTFSGNCYNQNARSSGVEPGGGATIMAYTDVCGLLTLQNVLDADADHFNTHSLSQMRTHLQSVSCPAAVANANRPPTVNAGPDYTIPRNTPFTLTATGSDPDGETVYYTWNQYDYTTNIGALGLTAGVGGTAAVDDPAAPLFRPRVPRTANARTFPDPRYVLANANRPADRIGEALPNVARTLNFVVTARDQRLAGGAFATDNVTLTVAADTGPFAVTAPNVATVWTGNRSATVAWSVNGTDQAPISVAQVRILLSTDGGQTFPTVLAAAAPNTGTATVAVPNVSTTQARLRVEAVGNIFFDVNDVNFSIAPGVPLPVVLRSFAARRAGAAVQLTWQTASETGVAHFEAQRSPDGVHFAALAQVPATNTTAPHDYALPDAAPLPGLSYYRLLVRDLDGSSAYSPVVAVDADAPAAWHLAAYPNPVPAGAALQLELHAPTAQPAELLATDGLGRIVLRRPVLLPAGRTLVALPEARTWHGLYMLSVQAAGGPLLRQKVTLE